MVKAYSNADERLSAHFRAGEFRCRCCGKMRVDTTLIGYLEQIYAYLNCSKIIVSSGYICPSHDKAVGGSGAGRHTMGMAADICCYGQDGQPIESKYVACAAEDLGINGIGLNCGENAVYTHIDSRSASAKWWGDESIKGKPSIQRINGSTSFYAYCGVPKRDCPYEQPTEMIRYGSRGNGVRWLQYMLISAGYDCGTVDGIAGVKTVAAIRAYQQDHGLAVDGIAGVKTVSALKSK